MLELRPICENCGKDLPNRSKEAIICTFECPFCSDCVTDVLGNVCPNCGGGFERRPIRPTQCLSPDCFANFPAKKEKRHRPVELEKFRVLKEHCVNVDPALR